MSNQRIDSTLRAAYAAGKTAGPMDPPVDRSSEEELAAVEAELARVKRRLGWLVQGPDTADRWHH